MPKKENIDHLLPFASKKAKAAFSQFFSGLALPVPAPDEFLKTRGGGAMLFLNSFGSVLRITDNAKYPPIDHGKIVQPLTSFTAGFQRAELFPGVKSPISSWSQVFKVRSDLESSGILFDDIQLDNCGYLSGLDEDDAENIVVIDIEACRQLHSITKDVKQLLDKAKSVLSWAGIKAEADDQVTPESRQSAFYKPLRESFKNICHPGTAMPDSKKVFAFWELCAQTKDAGKLSTCWNTGMMAKHRGIPDQAAKYEESLRRYHSHLQQDL